MKWCSKGIIWQINNKIYAVVNIYFQSTDSQNNSLEGVI
jgi:hypothetical protein